MDAWANLGRNGNLLETKIEDKDMNKLIEKKVYNIWCGRWEIERHSSEYGNVKTSLENWYWTRSKNRQVDVQLTRLKLRGVNLNKYLNRIGASDTDLCQKCTLQQPEDVNHFLIQCPAYRNERDILKNNLRTIGIYNIDTNILLGSSNYEIDIKKIITKELAKFLKATKRLY